MPAYLDIKAVFACKQSALFADAAVFGVDFAFAVRRFRQAIKELVASNDLPDYRLTYDDKKDVLRVLNRDLSKFLKKLP